MKNSILIFFGIFFLAFYFKNIPNNSLQNSNNCAELNINLDKSSYLFSEPILLEINLILNKNCKIEYQPEVSVGYDIDLKLSNSNGDTLEFNGGISDYILRKKIYDTVYTLYGLASGFGSPEVFHYKAIPNGIYNLQAKINIKSDKEINYYYSNTISLSINEPAGAEKEAHQKWVELKLAQKNKESVFRIKELVDDFLLLYPNSVYKDKMIINLFGTDKYIQTLQPKEQEAFALETIFSNPNSFYNWGYLDYLKYIYEDLLFKDDKSKVIEKLENLRLQNGNTLLSKFCGEKIKEIIASIQFKKEMKEKQK